MLCSWIGRNTVKCPYLMRTPDSGVHGVLDATNKFTQTAEVLWRKRDSVTTLCVREHLNLCLDRLYGFPVALSQRRFSFIILRFTLSDYFLQIAKKKMLQMQGNDKSD